jgi:PAT family beta-lactamase induction signal transducer AmpG
METETEGPAEKNTGAVPSAVWASTTYFGEGLSYSIVHQLAAQQYLTAAGVSPEIIGLASFLHAPWLFKFAWAPMVDGIGTTKRWMIGLALVLAGCSVAMAAAAAESGWMAVIWVLCAMSFIAATSDIAIDGYYIRSLDQKRQTALSGVRIGAFRLAMLFGSGLLVTLAGKTSFSASFLVAGLVFVALALLHIMILRPDARARVVAGDSIAKNAREGFKSFFARPGIVLAVCLILTYRAGDALLFAMNAKFLASLGLDTATRGIVNGTFGTAASIGGSLLGGFVIAKVGFKRAFLPITVLQAVALLFYAGLAVGQPSFATIAVVVVLEQLIAGVGTAAFVVFLLRLCHGPQKASHFALASSLMTFALMMSGAASGFLYVAVGPSWFFFVAFLVALPGVVLAAVVDKS